jgi:hypothetical protein
MNACFLAPACRINILLTALFFIAGCAPASPARPPAQATVTPARAPATQLPTVSLTAERESILESGQWSYVFYYEGLEQIVLVNGGPERSQPADDPLELWSWDGTQWSLVSADINGPVWRNFAAATYDSARDALVIHGGVQSAGSGFDETWEWDGQTWTSFTEQGPGAREGALMVYDVARAKTVLFGGAVNLEIKSDTWEWDGNTWTQVSETGPAPRFPGAMVYDPIRHEVLLYSGHFAETTGAFIDYDDLWAWNGEAWREIATDGSTPGHHNHTAFVFDPTLEKILLIGGGGLEFLGDTWVWDSIKWEEFPTSNLPARSGHSVAYDPSRDRFVLFGGVDRPGGKALADTWEWDRVEWVCVDNCQ